MCCIFLLFFLAWMLIFFASLVFLPVEGQDVVASFGGNVNFDANKERCDWDHPYVYIPKWKMEGQVCVTNCNGLSTDANPSSVSTSESFQLSCRSLGAQPCPTVKSSEYWCDNVMMACLPFADGTAAKTQANWINAF